jgi:hypothetical protein
MSFDFCNTKRSADSPRDSFVPRACAGRSQTRSPRLPPSRFTVKARTPKLRAALNLFRDALASEHRPGAPSSRMYSRSDLEEENEEQSPDSTRPEHPVVTDACVQALECPSLPHPPKAHLARLSREGQTHCDEPECFPPPGSSSPLGDRSPRVLRPASHHWHLARRA